jgi:hypothetical protein
VKDLLVIVGTRFSGQVDPMGEWKECLRGFNEEW